MKKFFATIAIIAAATAFCAAQNTTRIGEKHAVEVGVKCRHLARETRKVLLTRYFREARERTYFIPAGSCSAVDDEIAPPQ